jgi:hypothetical protein
MKKLTASGYLFIYLLEQIELKLNLVLLKVVGRYFLRTVITKQDKESIIDEYKKGSSCCRIIEMSSAISFPHCGKTKAIKNIPKDKKSKKVKRCGSTRVLFDLEQFRNGQARKGKKSKTIFVQKSQRVITLLKTHI